MFISILCCCLPIIHHSFPTIKFKDIIRAVPSYVIFGRLRSKRRDNFDSTDQNTRGWDSLEEYGSTHVPAWPRVKNHSGSHAPTDYPLGEWRIQKRMRFE